MKEGKPGLKISSLACPNAREGGLGMCFGCLMAGWKPNHDGIACKITMLQLQEWAYNEHGKLKDSED